MPYVHVGKTCSITESDVHEGAPNRIVAVHQRSWSSDCLLGPPLRHSDSSLILVGIASLSGKNCGGNATCYGAHPS